MCSQGHFEELVLTGKVNDLEHLIAEHRDHLTADDLALWLSHNNFTQEGYDLCCSINRNGIRKELYPSRHSTGVTNENILDYIKLIIGNEIVGKDLLPEFEYNWNDHMVLPFLKGQGADNVVHEHFHSIFRTGDVVVYRLLRKHFPQTFTVENMAKIINYSTFVQFKKNWLIDFFSVVFKKRPSLANTLAVWFYDGENHSTYNMYTPTTLANFERCMDLLSRWMSSPHLVDEAVDVFIETANERNYGLTFGLLTY